MPIFDGDTPYIFPSLSIRSSTSLLLNVSSTPTQYTIRTGLPGIPQNQISVNITQDGVLSIQAERHPRDEKKNIMDEREYEIIKENWVTQGKLDRSVKFPKDSIDVNNITARLSNGELVVKVLKKNEKEKENIKFIKVRL